MRRTQDRCVGTARHPRHLRSAAARTSREGRMSSSVPDFSLEARKALADAATALGGVESEPVVHAQVQATVGVGYAILDVLHELQRLEPSQ
jgi:hypothetical protein